MTEIVAVEINCPDAGTAARIAERLVGRRLAASANVHGPVESVFRWKGRIERAREVPLVLKTRAALLPSLVAEVRGLHPYETPSILARAVAANDDYAAWVLAETGAGDDG
jgi:periplasmic divalent cation tolerance protein